MIEIDCVKMMALITPLVRDVEGCAVLWSITTLANKEAIELIQKGLTVVIRKRGTEALLLCYNSMNDYVSVRMSSISNMKKLAMQVTSLSESLTNVILYHFCNIASTVVANTTVPSRNELSTIPEEIISGRVFLQSLTHYFPSSYHPI